MALNACASVSGLRRGATGPDGDDPVALVKQTRQLSFADLKLTTKMDVKKFQVFRKLPTGLVKRKGSETLHNFVAVQSSIVVGQAAQCTVSQPVCFQGFMNPRLATSAIRRGLIWPARVTRWVGWLL